MNFSNSAEFIDEAHNNYDKERRLFNGFHDIRPKYIVKCRCEQDVSSTISFAKENGLSMCVRAGGHSVAGLSMLEGGVVIDIAELNKVFVDPIAKLAVVEGGATLRDLDLATSSHDLATTGGIISNTGVGGLTLGGGLGWLMAAHGLACDNLLGADVMLSSGDIIRVDAENNSDLFLGLKGGCFNFGVVLRFEFSLTNVSKVVAGSIRHDFEAFTYVVRKFLNAEQSLSSATSLDLVLATLPTGKKSVLLDICCPSGHSDVDHDLELLDSIFKSSSDCIQTRNYVDWQIEFDDVLRSGRRAYWKSLSVPMITAEMINELEVAFKKVPSVHTQVSIDCIRGMALTEKNGHTLFGDRANRFVILLNSAWTDKQDDNRNIFWTRNLFQRLTRLAPDSDVYGNYLDVDDVGQRASCYYKMREEFMEGLRSRYDPTRSFHFLGS